MTCTNRNNGCRNCGERENGCGEERRRSNCCCCQGPKGEQGERGERGERGMRGEKGERGERGLRGERGERGERGLRGERGERGERGLRGERGERGESGVQRFVNAFVLGDNIVENDGGAIAFTDYVSSSDDDFVVDNTDVLVRQAGTYYISAKFYVPKTNSTQTVFTVKANGEAMEAFSTALMPNSCCVNSSAVGFFDGIVRLEADTVLTINSSEALCWDAPNSANNMANLTILRLK